MMIMALYKEPFSNILAYPALKGRATVSRRYAAKTFRVFFTPEESLSREGFFLWRKNDHEDRKGCRDFAFFISA